MKILIKSRDGHEDISKAIMSGVYVFSVILLLQTALLVYAACTFSDWLYKMTNLLIS